VPRRKARICLLLASAKRLIVVLRSRVKRIKATCHLIASSGIRSCIERITPQEKKRTTLLMITTRKVIFREST